MSAADPSKSSNTDVTYTVEEIEEIFNNPPLLDTFLGTDGNPVDHLARSQKYENDSASSDRQNGQPYKSALVAASNRVDGGSLSIVLASLFELICHLKEADNGKQQKLFKYVAREFSRLKIIPTLCFSEALLPARQQFQAAITSLIDKVSTQFLPTNSTESLMLQQWSLHPSKELKIFNRGSRNDFFAANSKFKNEFEEICELGKGGFGQVLKVRSYIDEQFYAVKKIYFDVTRSALCFKVLREVKLLAILSHPNIVRYFGAWLEFEPTSILLENSSSALRSSGLRATGQRRIPNIVEMTDESVTNGRSLSKLNTSFSSPNISFVKSGSKSAASNVENAIVETNSERQISPSSSDDSSENRSSENDDVASEFDKSLRNSWPLTKSLVLYLQMELGSFTLRDWLTERNGQVSDCRDSFSCVDSCVNEKILKQLLKALDYIHDKGIIHRDIKPSNIFLKQPDNRVLLGDFGLACLIDDENSKVARNSNIAVSEQHNLVETRTPYHSTGVGTFAYSAPEQLKTHFYDQKVDMYSVGVIAFELYSPFRTNMERMHMIMELRRGELSDAFQHKWPVETVFVKQLVQKNPALRPQAKELLESGFFQTKNDLLGALKLQLQDQSNEIERLRKEIFLLKSTFDENGSHKSAKD